MISSIKKGDTEGKLQACDKTLNIRLLRKSPIWTKVSPTHLGKWILEEQVIPGF
jgi:hypothetical protein